MVIKHWPSILLPNVIFRYGVKSAQFVQGTDVYSYITSFSWSTPNSALEKDLHYHIRLAVVVQALIHVWLVPTQWTAVCQASLSFTISLSLLKLISIDSVNLSNHLITTSPHALNLSQHQDLFQWVSSSHQVAKVVELQLQHQSFQWIFRVDFL